MSLRATTGCWVVRADGRLIGPFDGRGPASTFRGELRRQGIDATAERLWPPSEARKAIRPHKD